MLDVFTKVILAGACLFTFAWVILAQLRTIKRLSDAYLRLTHFQRVVAALAVIVCTVYAQKPSTNDVEGVARTNQVEIVDGGDTNQVGEAASSPLLLMMLPPLTSGEDAASPLSDADCARGYRLEGVSTNSGISYAMPHDGTIRGTWHLTGAYEDIQKVTLDAFVFPLGSGLCTSLWAYTWGKVRPQLKNVSNEIAAVGAPMSAIPEVSRFWTAVTSNDTYLLTWENFAAGRVRGEAASSPLQDGILSAQIELFRNGDFITRSNKVEKVYRRIDPDDWDGDGWRNGDDPDPYNRDGFYDDFSQELPDGANESAYCWIEFRPRWHSYIEFAGDGPSNLDDPYFYGRAGETYRVQLLIGKTYFIESTQPLDVVNRSDSSIEIDGDGTCELEVVWPVRMSVLESNGSGFRMVVRPSGLGGFFNWTDSCCTVYGSDHVFRYGCSGNCGCSGCYAHGYYEYEGYRLETTGGWCGCSPDDDNPGEDPDDPPLVGVSVSFSNRAIIFEDSYANTTNDIVPWNSTATELACTINGGPNGGYVQIEISGGDNLIQYTGQSLPYSRVVAPNERIEFTNRYKATVESVREDDVEVTATFVENETGWVDESEAKATAVRVEVQPVVGRSGCEYRHMMGVREDFEVQIRPNTQKRVDLDPDWELSSLGANMYRCPIRADNNGIRLTVLGSSYAPSIQVLEPSGIVCSSGFNRCADGVIAMELEPYITPLSVSFFGINMVELPTEYAGPDGYFTNECFRAIWYHSPERKAGEWKHPRTDNFFFADTPSFGDFCPQPWSGGSIDWAIPLAWGELNSSSLDDCVDTIDTIYHQVFTIDALGTLKIDKFTQWIQCTAEGWVTYSPGIR